MSLVLTGLALIGAGAILSLLLARWPARAAAASVTLTTAGCALGLITAIDVLMTGDQVGMSAVWPVAMGSFTVGVDALSALFLAVTFVLAPLAGVFGAGYMKGASGRQAAVAWPMFGLLTGSIALVLIAQNAVLFIVAWEAMAVSSYFLVTLNDRGVEVRNAGKIYLVASHLSVAFLLVFFLVLASGEAAGSALDFANLPPVASAGRAGALFVMALVGFGTKAGLMPFHVALPEADTAAPSHIASLMSAVVIKAGVYGLLRAVQLIGAPEPWWGWSLIGIGTLSAVLGAALAFAQNDIKRLLAYSTVENAGLIAAGIGVGLLGQAHGSTTLTVLGYGGAMLHAINHALFKGLLFLGAGAVDRATGTRDVDRLGGLLKAMPLTGIACLAGAMAASGMPVFGGFSSEFVLFRAGLAGGTDGATGDTALVLLAAGGTGLSGALAAATHLKAFGTVFLGTPRAETTVKPHEPSALMWGPMWLLAGLSVAAAFSSPWLFGKVAEVVSGFAAGSEASVAAAAAPVRDALSDIVLIGGVLMGVVAAVALLRLWLLRARQVTDAVTWDCGYAKPGASMQYTGSSFAEPVVSVLEPLVRRVKVVRPAGLFPRSASVETATADPAREAVYRAAATRTDRALLRLRWLQHGRLNLYVLYVAVTLAALLVWGIGFS